MARLLNQEFLDQVALVYGEECKLFLIDMVAGAPGDSDLRAMLELAVQKAYESQFLVERAAKGDK